MGFDGRRPRRGRRAGGRRPVRRRRLPRGRDRRHPRRRRRTPSRCPASIVDEPVLRMTFGVNTSPLAGKDGQVPHLAATCASASSARCSATCRSACEDTDSPDVIEVAGRGELQLAVLIESMRREGYELQVSRPEVITKEIDGKRHEPLERGVVDVPDEHVGTVTQALAPRKGRVTDLRPGDPGRTIVTFEAPARGLIGFRSLLLTATRGTALLHQHHAGWMPWAGELPHRTGGAMIADRIGRRPPATPSTTCSCAASCSSAPASRSTRAWSSARARRPDDMVVNVVREKEKTNIRTHSHDEAVKLAPPRDAHARDGHRVHRRRRAGRGHARRPSASASGCWPRPTAAGRPSGADPRTRTTLAGCGEASRWGRRWRCCSARAASATGSGGSGGSSGSGGSAASGADGAATTAAAPVAGGRPERGVRATTAHRRASPAGAPRPTTR